ncbi:MAG: hypothetical protein ACHP8A_03550 [Terriglobales bacterium]
MPFRSHRPNTFWLILLFLIFGSSFLCAQKLPEIDVYGGPTYTRFNSPSIGFSSDSSLTGGVISFTAPHLYEELGLTISASGGYGSRLKAYNFLLGPQFTFEEGRMRLFGDILFGKAETKVAINQPTRSEITSVGRAIALGGGLEISLKHHISVRPIDADYVFSKTFGSSQNNIRISAGVVYRFGKK